MDHMSTENCSNQFIAKVVNNVNPVSHMLPLSYAIVGGHIEVSQVIISAGSLLYLSENT